MWFLVNRRNITKLNNKEIIKLFMLFTIAVLWVKFSPAPYAPLLF